jgi:hypothetical protein
MVPRALLVRALVALAVSAMIPARDAAAGPRVALDGDRISIESRGDTVATVLDELERVAFVTVELPDALRGRVLTVSIRDRDVEHAVRAILRHLAVENVAVIYQGGSIRFIALTSPPSDEVVSGMPPEARPADPAREPQDVDEARADGVIIAGR